MDGCVNDTWSHTILIASTQSWRALIPARFSVLLPGKAGSQESIDQLVGQKNPAGFRPFRTVCGHPWFTWMYLQRYLDNRAERLVMSGEHWNKANVKNYVFAFVFWKIPPFSPQIQSSRLMEKRLWNVGNYLWLSHWISWFSHIWLNPLFSSANVRACFVSPVKQKFL